MWLITIYTKREKIGVKTNTQDRVYDPSTVKLINLINGENRLIEGVENAENWLRSQGFHPCGEKIERIKNAV